LGSIVKEGNFSPLITFDHSEDLFAYFLGGCQKVGPSAGTNSPKTIASQFVTKLINIKRESAF
jgi:hypothetical protein